MPVLKLIHWQVLESNQLSSIKYKIFRSEIGNKLNAAAVRTPEQIDEKTHKIENASGFLPHFPEAFLRVAATVENIRCEK